MSNAKWLLALIGILAFGFFIWPTPYEYRFYNGYPVKLNTLTNHFTHVIPASSRNFRIYGIDHVYMLAYDLARRQRDSCIISQIELAAEHGYDSKEIVEFILEDNLARDIITKKRLGMSNDNILNEILDSSKNNE